MHPVLQKQSDAALHILDLILSCQKAEAGVISVLSEAFTRIVPNPAALNIGLLGESLKDLKSLCIESERCSASPAPDASAPEAPAQPAAAKPAPARKKATAPAAEAPPAAAPAAPAAPPAAAPAQPEPNHDLPEDQGITQEAADRLRQLVRDTFTARSKKITAEGDPNNTKKADYTNQFTAAVKSFGADTVTGTDNSKLQALLDAVRAL